MLLLVLLFDTTDTTDTCKHVWCFVRDDTDRRIAKDVLAYELQKLEVAAMKKQQFFKSFLGGMCSRMYPFMVLMD